MEIVMKKYKKKQKRAEAETDDEKHLCKRYE